MRIIAHERETLTKHRNTHHRPSLLILEAI